MADEKTLEERVDALESKVAELGKQRLPETTELTRDEVEQMSPEQVNERWDDVQAALGKENA